MQVTSPRFDGHVNAAKHVMRAEALAQALDLSNGPRCESAASQSLLLTSEQ